MVKKSIPSVCIECITASVPVRVLFLLTPTKKSIHLSLDIRFEVTASEPNKCYLSIYQAVLRKLNLAALDTIPLSLLTLTLMLTLKQSKPVLNNWIWPKMDKKIAFTVQRMSQLWQVLIQDSDILYISKDAICCACRFLLITCGFLKPFPKKFLTLAFTVERRAFCQSALDIYRKHETKWFSSFFLHIPCSNRRPINIGLS